MTEYDFDTKVFKKVKKAIVHKVSVKEHSVKKMIWTIHNIVDKNGLNGIIDNVFIDFRAETISCNVYRIEFDDVRQEYENLKNIEDQLKFEMMYKKTLATFDEIRLSKYGYIFF